MEINGFKFKLDNDHSLKIKNVLLEQVEVLKKEMSGLSGNELFDAANNISSIFHAKKSIDYKSPLQQCISDIDKIIIECNCNDTGILYRAIYPSEILKLSAVDFPDGTIVSKDQQKIVEIGLYKIQIENGSEKGKIPVWVVPK